MGTSSAKVRKPALGSLSLDLQLETQGRVLATGGRKGGLWCFEISELEGFPGP